MITGKLQVQYHQSATVRKACSAPLSRSADPKSAIAPFEWTYAVVLRLSDAWAGVFALPTRRRHNRREAMI
jgi:hypothetical protein